MAAGWPLPGSKSNRIICGQNHSSRLLLRSWGGKLNQSVDKARDLFEIQRTVKCETVKV